MLTEVLWGVCIVVGLATGNVLVGIGVMLFCVLMVATVQAIIND